MTAITATDTGNKTFYAKWTPDTYTVTLNVNGGTIDDGNVTSYAYGTGATLPTETDVTKTGNTFEGWYDNESFTGNAVTAITETDTGNKTFYAKWTPDTYTVTLNVNGGTVDSGNVTSYTYGTGATLPTDVTKANYDFGGWYDNESCDGTEVTEITASDAGDKTFYAKWTLTEFNITYEMDGGTNNVDNPEKYTVETGDFTLKYPTKSGYVFTGWSTQAGGTAIMEITVTQGNVGPLTFYANWEADNTAQGETEGVVDSHIVGCTSSNFEDAAKNEAGDVGTNQYVKEELKVEEKAEADVSNAIKTKANDIFIGVDESNLSKKFIEMDVKKYVTTITLEKTIDNPVEVTDMKKAVEVKVDLANLGYTAPIPDNLVVIREHATQPLKVFGKLNTQPAAGSEADGTFFITGTDLYIYTQYFSMYSLVSTSATVHTVKIDPNGGTVSGDTTLYVSDGSTITLPTPTKTSNSFAGWFDAPTGGNKISSSMSVTADITLFAHWTANAPTPEPGGTGGSSGNTGSKPSGGSSGSSGGGGGGYITTYKISYDLDGGTVAAANPTTYTSSTATFTLTNPTKDGYTFKGWIGTGINEAAITVTVEKGSKGDKSYKATWEKNVDSLSDETDNTEPGPDTISTENSNTKEQNALLLNSGLKVTQTGSKITVKWGKVTEATGYKVYAAYCGQKFPTKATVTTKNDMVSITKLAGKKLNLNKNFKVFVVAMNGSSRLGKSITAHVVGRKNVNYTNAKSIKVTSNTKLTMEKGKTAMISAETILVDPKKKQLSNAHAKEFRYASSNKEAAIVSRSGKIKAVGNGTATIYVYSRNGLAKTVKVIVK